VVGIDPKTLKVGDAFYDACGCHNVVLRVDKHCIRMNDLDGDLEWELSVLSRDWEDSEMIEEADNPAAGTGHPRFLALLDQLRAMHLAKSADYGTAEDVYANYRRTAKLGIQPSKGILIRMADKWSRIETWANGGTLKNEGVVDSLLDLASYAIGAVVMIEEEANGTK